MIDPGTLAQLAFSSLRRHKLRTFLAVLGIVIGVTSVIVMVGFGEGARKLVDQQIASLGSNFIVVMPGTLSRGGVMQGTGTQITLTEQDAQAIERECPSVRYVAPGLRFAGQVVYKNRNWNTWLGGSSTDYVFIRNWSPDRGRFFSDEEVKSQAKVAVLGQTVVKELFGDQDPVDQMIRIKDIPFKVVGVLPSKGESYMGVDQDDTILMPYTTLERRLMGINFISTVMVSAIFEPAIPKAIQEIKLLLRERHRIPSEKEDDFTIKTQVEIAETAGEVSKVMTLFLGSIALISLLVGGIGIMNIMLVSVTERTREIGIRMAVGAQERDILLQFIFESVVLCLLGGTIGVLLGFLIILGLSYFSSWLVLLVPSAVVLAFLFSAGVGLFFGYYPARKAAKLKPIEALRYE